MSGKKHRHGLFEAAPERFRIHLDHITSASQLSREIIRSAWGWALAGSVLMALGGLATTLIPAWLGRTVDTVVAPAVAGAEASGVWRELVIALACLGGMYLVIITAQRLEHRFSWYGIQRAEHELSQQLLELTLRRAGRDHVPGAGLAADRRRAAQLPGAPSPGGSARRTASAAGHHRPPVVLPSLAGPDTDHRRSPHARRNVPGRVAARRPRRGRTGGAGRDRGHRLRHPGRVPDPSRAARRTGGRRPLRHRQPPHPVRRRQVPLRRGVVRWPRGADRWPVRRGPGGPGGSSRRRGTDQCRPAGCRDRFEHHRPRFAHQFHREPHRVVGHHAGGRDAVCST